MFGAAAVRKKRKEKQAADANKEKTRGPYIKPFGPRFDPNTIPYFKYKVNNSKVELELRYIQLKYVSLSAAKHCSTQSLSL